MTKKYNYNSLVDYTYEKLKDNSNKWMLYEQIIKYIGLDYGFHKVKGQKFKFVIYSPKDRDSKGDCMVYFCEDATSKKNIEYTIIKAINNLLIERDYQKYKQEAI